MPSSYNPANWYWVVAGSTTQVYSSLAVAYVSVSDPTYLAWKSKGNKPTNIAVEQDLWDLLTLAGVPIPVSSSISDAQKETEFADIPLAVQRWAFAIDNRVRVLEGQATRTVAQFKTYVKSLL